jgi:ubiquinone/menaquinone biosynthesis C-methylase UbiE
MKWLERNPRSYDRGIRILTLGRIVQIQNDVVERFVRQGMDILELGCGTGELACRMGQKGAKVVAIDIAPAMLAMAEKRIAAANLSEQVELKRLDATAVGELADVRKFDLVVASLVLSELSPNEQKLVIRACRDLLNPGGSLILVDEVMPESSLKRLGYSLVRFPLALITFLLTRTTTRSLQRIEVILAQNGYSIQTKDAHLGGSLHLIVSEVGPDLSDDEQARMVPRIPARSLWQIILIRIWTLFFRVIPPYPKVAPDLYRVGNPAHDSPLLATGNFELTVLKVLDAVEGVLDVWLLVIDTSGINVWCAAGGGFLTAEKVVSAMKANHVEAHMNHRNIVLPQLCANGVDGWKLREGTGWNVIWGPVTAKDIPEFIEGGFQKSNRLRSISFPLKDRLEMVSGTLGLYAMLLLLPIAIFWRHLFWPALAALAGLSYFYAIVLPWLPGKDGLWKSIPLTFLSLSGVILFTLLFDPVPVESLYNRVFGVGALSIFVSAEFQGMSPLMRGEQANWIPQAFIGGILAILYRVTPIVLGWR